jgi:PilZ domain
MSTPAVACAGELSKTLTGLECRVHPRHESDFQTSLQPIAARGSNDVTWPARIRDVSAGGIGLILQRRFERGAGLAIELPDRATGGTYSVFAKVVHVASVPDGSWRLGCLFVNELDDEALQALLDIGRRQLASPTQPEVTIGSPTESERQFPATPPANGHRPTRRLVITRVCFEGYTSDGTIIRRKISRLFLSGPWPFTPGTPLSGWVGREAGAKPLFELEVKSCTWQGNSWNLVCWFVNTPTAQAVKLFAPPKKRARR